MASRRSVSRAREIRERRVAVVYSAVLDNLADLDVARRLRVTLDERADGLVLVPRDPDKDGPLRPVAIPHIGHWRVVADDLTAKILLLS